MLLIVISILNNEMATNTRPELLLAASGYWVITDEEDTIKNLSHKAVFLLKLDDHQLTFLGKLLLFWPSIKR